MSELKEFKLPDVGEGLTEADIVRWHVKPGDQVTLNQIIVEIETAKAVVELPSPYEGVVAKLLVSEGQTADVGTPIIAVQVGAGASAVPMEAAPAGAARAQAPEDAVPAEAAAQRLISENEDLVPSPPIEGAVEPGIHGSPAPKAERQAVLVGYGVKLGSTARRARKTTSGRPANGGAAPAPSGPVPAAASAAPSATRANANGAGAGGGPGGGARGGWGGPAGRA